MRGDAKLRAKAKSGSSARSGIRTGGTDIDEAFDATWAEMPKMLRVRLDGPRRCRPLPQIAAARNTLKSEPQPKGWRSTAMVSYLRSRTIGYAQRGSIYDCRGRRQPEGGC